MQNVHTLNQVGNKNFGQSQQEEIIQKQNTRIERLQNMYDKSQEHIETLTGALTRSNRQMIERNQLIVELMEYKRNDIQNKIDDLKSELSDTDSFAKQLEKENERLESYIKRNETLGEQKKVGEEEVLKQKYRENLKRLEGSQIKIVGRYIRDGHKRNAMDTIDTTVLLRDIKDENGNLLCEYIWMNKTTRIQNVNLEPHDLVEMVATVSSYEKIVSQEDGTGSRIAVDYCLKNPSKVRKVEDSGSTTE